MSTNDFISIFLSIELQSYGLYLLSTIYRNSELSTTGGLIYFLLGGLSSCFILLGTSLLYANSGTTNMDSLYVITSISDLNNYGNSWYNDDYINFSLLIFTIGFLFKVSAAPFHFWSPAKRFGKSFIRVKLSNSGNTLELQVPNYNWKVISGWINYSCMVISRKNPEKEVGNRGSKSDMLSVKEQRVYDNWPTVSSLGLRCILRGFERDLRVKIPSKQIINSQQLFSTFTTTTFNTIAGGCGVPSSFGQQQRDNNLKVLPWFITGFADAEGCFMITVRKAPRQILGWQIEANFSINLHKRDVELLKHIQAFFGGVGRISKERNGCIDFTIGSIHHILTQVIPHFDKYPLITQKGADYLLFKQAVMIMHRKEHLTISGLETIINIRATLNRGLTPALIEAFPKVAAVARPLVDNVDVKLIDPQWIAGFTSGDGSFIVSIRDYKSNQTPSILPLAQKSKWLGCEGDGRVSLTFSLMQHSRDELLMKSLVNYFGFGKAYTYKDKTEFKSQGFANNYEKVIPFFQKYPILGIKSLDFIDWCKVANLINNKAHLTKEGFRNIRNIKAGMNNGRIKNS